MIKTTAQALMKLSDSFKEYLWRHWRLVQTSRAPRARVVFSPRDPRAHFWTAECRVLQADALPWRHSKYYTKSASTNDTISILFTCAYMSVVQTVPRATKLETSHRLPFWFKLISWPFGPRDQLFST